METLDVVPNVQAAHGRAAVLAAADHGEHINNRDLAQEVIGGVIENAAHGCIRSAHDALHAVDRPQEVTAVDAVTSASPDQDVFVIVRHANYFVWHHLSQGEDEIEAAANNQAIHLRRPCVIQFAFGLLAN